MSLDVLEKYVAPDGARCRDDPTDSMDIHRFTTSAAWRKRWRERLKLEQVWASIEFFVLPRYQHENMDLIRIADSDEPRAG